MKQNLLFDVIQSSAWCEARNDEHSDAIIALECDLRHSACACRHIYNMIKSVAKNNRKVNFEILYNIWLSVKLVSDSWLFQGKHGCSLIFRNRDSEMNEDTLFYNPATGSKNMVSILKYTVLILFFLYMI
jgi:hypothetical protein